MFSTCERLISIFSECFLRVNVFFMCLVNVFYVWTSYFCIEWMFSTCECLLYVFSECFLRVNVLLPSSVNVFYCEGLIYLFCWVCLPSCLIYILCGVLCKIHVNWWSCSPYIYSASSRSVLWLWSKISNQNIISHRYQVLIGQWIMNFRLESSRVDT
jgi:hypothetical protein